MYFLYAEKPNEKPQPNITKPQTDPKTTAKGCATLIVFGLIAFFLIKGCYTDSQNAPDRIVDYSNHNPSQEAIPVSAKYLAAEYEDNEIGADSKYKGKLLRVSSFIIEIKNDGDGEASLYLNTSGSQFEVRCTTPDMDMVAKLKTKQSIFVEGTCIGLSTSTIWIKDCRIIP